MPASVGFILVFMLGFWSGMAWIRASRADRAEKLVKTIAALRAELAHERLTSLATWMREDDD